MRSIRAPFTVSAMRVRNSKGPVELPPAKPAAASAAARNVDGLPARSEPGGRWGICFPKSPTKECMVGAAATTAT